jgi:hypothetical protein
VLPYIWGACSTRGTVVRIATAEHFDPIRQATVYPHQILGEYWSAPEGCRQTGNPDAGPSRTTVDFDGSVWVANRHDIVETDGGPFVGHVVKLGNGLAYQWKDRHLDPVVPGGIDYNENGHLDTSTGLGDIRPWPNDNDKCQASDVNLARDELILLYQPVPATGTRTVAVDRNNNVWVGGYGNGKHGLLDGQTGALFDSGDGIFDFPFADYGCGGYGGVVDASGVLWSSRGVGPGYPNSQFRGHHTYLLPLAGECGRVGAWQGWRGSWFPGWRIT